MLTPKITALLLTGSVLLAAGAIAPATHSALGSGDRSTEITSRKSPEYSDDELLRAILFGTGRVAVALGVSVSDDAPLPDDFDEIATQAVQRFRAEHAAETDAALTAFRSANPVRVHEAVRSLQQTFQQSYVRDVPKIENGALCATINLAVVGNLAIAINVGIAVAVAFVTWVVTYQVDNEADAELISARLSDLGRK